MMTLGEFQAQLERSVSSVKPQLEIGLDKVGEFAKTLAAHYIGTERPEWPPLAQATIEDKAAKGYATPAPLLRTGEMRDSIKKELDPVGLEVAVGSNEPKALWQELGTSRGIPPRSFLGLAMTNALPYAAETFEKIALKILTGK